MKKLLLILLCLPFIGLGQQSFNFQHDGLNREYIYYSPTNLALDAPLVFVAHGYTQSAQGIMSFSGMNAIADSNGFAVCYPQGTTDSWGQNFWNVGYNFHSGVTVDDVDFLESLASFLQSNYQLSSNNTFITGFSNGGEISYLLAFDGSNVFKAFAPVAGTVFPNGTINNLFTPNMPVPMFVTHGYNDSSSYYYGDLNNQLWGPNLSVDTLVDFWINENSLTNFNVDTFPDLNNDGNITISKKHFSSSTNNEVWLYSHNNGHNWGDSDIVIEQEIWDFFSLFVNCPSVIISNNNLNGCDSVLVGSNYYSISGVYTDTLTSVNSCDSVVNTNLTIWQNTASYDTLTVSANIVWNGIPLNVSGDYSVILINSFGCDSIVNLNLTITIPSSILHITNTEKTIVKITNMLGQETPYRRNTTLFYIYDDGTVEKRIVIE